MSAFGGKADIQSGHQRLRIAAPQIDWLNRERSDAVIFGSRLMRLMDHNQVNGLAGED
jgi:hypothetical protein